MIDLDQDEETLFRANIAWLETAGPDDWHRVMLDFNWSEPLYVLDWIVRQPECDVATAATIFWLGQPECWIGEEGENDEEPNGYSYLNAQICAYIANRVRAAGYTRSEIAYEPDTWKKQDYLGLVEAERTLENPSFRTHSDLIRNRSGRAVDLNADFYRRYPAQFHLSHFDEQFSEDIEQGRYFTPETRKKWDEYQEIERKAAESLPDWLQKKPMLSELQSTATDTEGDASARVRAMRRQADTDVAQEDTSQSPMRTSEMALPLMQEVRVDASILIGNLMILGCAATYLKFHANSQAMSVIAIAGVLVIIAYCIYSTIDSFRDLKQLASDNNLAMSDRWLLVAVNASFAMGALIGLVLGGKFSAIVEGIRADYGVLAAALLAFVVTVPVVALISWCLAPLLVNRRSIRWSALDL